MLSHKIVEYIEHQKEENLLKRRLKRIASQKSGEGLGSGVLVLVLVELVKIFFCGRDRAPNDQPAARHLTPYTYHEQLLKLEVDKYPTT